MVGTNTESKLQVVPIIRFFIIRILVFLLLTSYFAWKGLFVDYYFQMMAFISLELDERIILFNFKVLDAAVSIMIAPNGLWTNMIREDCIRFLIYMWAFKKLWNLINPGHTKNFSCQFFPNFLLSGLVQIYLLMYKNMF